MLPHVLSLLARLWPYNTEHNTTPVVISRWRHLRRFLCFSLYFYVFFKLSTGQYFCNQEKYPASVQSLSHVQLFATPWIAACQASMSITNSWSLLKLLSIELGMPSNHLILCHPLLLPSILPLHKMLASGSFLMSQFFTSSGQSIGVSTSAPVLPMNIQDWFPLGKHK